MEFATITSKAANIIVADADIILSQAHQGTHSQFQGSQAQDQDQDEGGHMKVGESLSTILIESSEFYQSPDTNSSSKKRKGASNDPSVGGNTGTGASGGAKQHQLPMFLTSWVMFF